MVIVLGRLAEQQVVDGDRGGGAEQRELAHPRAVARRGLQRDQGTHAVADQVGLVDLHRIQERHEPVRHLRNRASRRPLREAMAGQVDRQHAAAMPGEIARLEFPDRVIEGGAVHEDGDRQAGIERPATSGGEDAQAVYAKLHG